jgi:hypothetical protein
VIARRGYGFLPPVSQTLGLDRQGGEGYDQLRVPALIK